MNIILCSGDKIQGQSIVLLEGKSIDMTTDRLKQMVEDFVIPHTAAFAYIFLDTKQEANILIGFLKQKNYKTIYHLTNGYHEVRFWGNKK